MTPSPVTCANRQKVRAIRTHIHGKNRINRHRHQGSYHVNSTNLASFFHRAFFALLALLSISHVSKYDVSKSGNSGAVLFAVAEDLCAYFSTTSRLSELANLPKGANLDTCASSLTDNTPECILTCDTTNNAFRLIAGSGVITCSIEDLIPGSNSEPDFTYEGTLSCEDMQVQDALDAHQLRMDINLDDVTAGNFIPANITVVDTTDGSVLPVLDGQACVQLVDPATTDNSWAYLRAAEVQEITLTANANYSQFYQVNPDDPLEVLPLTAADIEINTTLDIGSFALQFVHNRYEDETPAIQWNASELEMQTALQELEYLHMVTVSKRDTIAEYIDEELGQHPFGTVVTGVTFTTVWSVTFRDPLLVGSDLQLLNPIWLGNGCSSNKCVGFEHTESNYVTVSEAVAGSFWPCSTFDNGVAHFPTLQINELGVHAIHFYFDRWQVDGTYFNVSVGPVATVLLQTEPGFGYGGHPFASQPVVVAADLGGNALTNMSYGSVTVSLLYAYNKLENESSVHENPQEIFDYKDHDSTSNNATLGPEEELTRRFDQGLASFRQLSIDRPGLYTLLFNTSFAGVEDVSIALEWPYVLHHRQRIGVGAPYQLGIRSAPTLELAGTPFEVNPVIELQDEAGNVVAWDSQSRVLVSIVGNPCHGRTGGSGEINSSLFNRAWNPANATGCGTLMRHEVQRLSVYLGNFDSNMTKDVTFEVGFQMGVKVTTAGQFDRFDYYGPNENVIVGFNFSASDMRAALESLSSIGVISVSKTSQIGDNSSIADWDVTFISDKGNIPALRLGCVNGIDCNSAFDYLFVTSDPTNINNTNAHSYVVAMEVEEIVHGCLSPETCLDPEDFYVDGLAAVAEDGVVTFTELSIDTIGSGYRLQFELEGSDGNITVVTDANLDIINAPPAFLAASSLGGHGHWANGEAQSDSPNSPVMPLVVSVWDAGFNRIQDLTTGNGFVRVVISNSSNPASVTQTFVDHGADSICTDISNSFVPSHWAATGVAAGPCRSICTAASTVASDIENQVGVCSGFMTNGTALSMRASQSSDTSQWESISCKIFVNDSFDDQVKFRDSVCPPATFTVTTDWNHTSFAVNGLDLATLTDNAVADRASQLYDFWTQENGGGYAIVALASPCTPEEIVAARAFHVDREDSTATEEWQAELEIFLEEDIASGNVVMVSLEWQDLQNCDNWQGLVSDHSGAVKCPASSTGLSQFLGATVTAADVQACNAQCQSEGTGVANCSYSLVAVKGLHDRNGGINTTYDISSSAVKASVRGSPMLVEFLNCTRVIGCGYELKFSNGGCQSGEFETFDHAVVLGDPTNGNFYSVEDCYEACRAITWCEEFAAGVSGSMREGECLVYSGECSTASDDTSLATFKMLPCSAQATFEFHTQWEFNQPAAVNSTDPELVVQANNAAVTSEQAMEPSLFQPLFGVGSADGSNSRHKDTAAGSVSAAASDFVQDGSNYRCFQQAFNPEYDVRTGSWLAEVNHGWANFSTLGFARAGDYSVTYSLIHFVEDETRGQNYRCPSMIIDADNNNLSNTDYVLFQGFTSSLSECQAKCADVDMSNSDGSEVDCRFAIYWSGYGATGYCELCGAPMTYFQDGYFRGSVDHLVPVDGADARQGRREDSLNRFPTTVYARRDYSNGNVQETVKMEVKEAAEFVVKADVASLEQGQMLGNSVAVGEGGIIVTGAYGASVPTYEVQVLRTQTDTNVWAPEVQVLQIGVMEHSHEIQRITLLPLDHEDVDGSFTVSWNGRGPSREVSFDISAVQLEKILEEDLPGIGDLEITRHSDWQCSEPYGDCLYQWKITFVSVNETYLGCHAFSDGQGTAVDGTACAYPFKVGDQVFTSCANGHEEGGNIAAGGDPDRWWCATTYDFDTDRLWGFCECPEFGSWPEITVDATNLVGNTTCVDEWSITEGHICRSYSVEALNQDLEGCEIFALENGYELLAFDSGDNASNATQCLLCSTTDVKNSSRFDTYTHSLNCSYDHPELLVDTMQHAAVIGGSFTLNGEGNSSVQVQWNETRDALLQKIESNLLTTDYLGNLTAIDLIDVNRGLPDAHSGYTWTVTFNPSDTVYDVPELRILGQHEGDASECMCEGDCCNNTGSVPGLVPEGNTVATVYTFSNGTAPLGEWFNLYFLGAGPSGDIAYNATAEEMEYALQQLATIDDVDVSVAPADSNTDQYGNCREGSRCYNWAVTFKRTRRFTDYGYVIDSLGNLPALEVDTTLLTGTNAEVYVDYLYEGSPQLNQEGVVRGNDGTRAGAVYVYVPREIAQTADERTNLAATHTHAWHQQARLTASDAEPFDLFGYSVAVDGLVEEGFSVVDRPARVLIGAPGHVHKDHIRDLDGSFNQSVGGAYVFERRLNRSARSANASTTVGINTNTLRHHYADDGTITNNEVTYEWVEVQLLQPEDAPHDDYGWGFGSSVTIYQDVLAVSAPNEREGHGAVYVYHLENNFEDVQVGEWVEIQRLTSPSLTFSGETEETGSNAEAEVFGDTVQIEDELMVVSAPGMYDGLGAVFLYEWVNDEHAADSQAYSDRESFNESSTYRHFSFQQRFIHPDALEAATAEDFTLLDTVNASGFGVSVSITAEFVVVGAPFAEDGVGRVFVFSKQSGSSHFELAQTLSPIDDYKNGHFGVEVAVSAHIIAVAARQKTDLTMSEAATVQLITIQAGSNVEFMEPGQSYFSLGFRQKAWEEGDLCYRDSSILCPNEEMGLHCYTCQMAGTSVTPFVTIGTPRLTNDALAEDVRVALERLGTGPLKVKRTQNADTQGAYAWMVTFLDVTRFTEVPMIEPYANELQGASETYLDTSSVMDAEDIVLTTMSVELLAAAPQQIDSMFSTIYTFTTTVSTAEEIVSPSSSLLDDAQRNIESYAEHTSFVEQGVWFPEHAQAADLYGSSVALHQSTMAVGAPNRIPSDLKPDMNAGAVFVNNLALLDIQVTAKAQSISEDSTAIDVVSRRCSNGCVPPTRGTNGLWTDLGPMVEGMPLVGLSGHQLRCLSPSDLSQRSGERLSSDSVLSTVYVPLQQAVSEGHRSWTLRIDDVSHDESFIIFVAASQSLYEANHSHYLTNEETESYWLPGKGFGYEAQTGKLVNFSNVKGHDSIGPIFSSKVYGLKLYAGDLVTVTLDLTASSTGTVSFEVNGVSLGVAARGLYTGSHSSAGSSEEGAVHGGVATAYRLGVGIVCGATDGSDPQNQVSLQDDHEIFLTAATGDEVSDSEVDNLLLRRASWYLNNVDGQSQYLPYGTASGRSTCLTSLDMDACLWVHDKSLDGEKQRVQSALSDSAGIEGTSTALYAVYDFDATSDYIPLNVSISHVPLDHNQEETVSVMVTNDHIIEVPDEFFNLVWSAPGFTPSLGGGFWSQVTVEDDGDGALGTTSFVDKLFGTDMPSALDRSGTSVATSGQWAMIGSIHGGGNSAKPAGPLNTQLEGRRGSVSIFYQHSGVWSLVQELTVDDSMSPLLAKGNAIPNNKSYFGASLDLDLENKQLIVGAFGEGAAYVFVLNDTDVNIEANNGSLGLWTFQTRLSVPHSQSSRTSFFGWYDAVAISGLYAAIGAKGLEAVYIFMLNETANEWLLHQTLRSGDFYQYTAVPTINGHSTTYTLQQEFGCSVSLSLTTLAVGARRAHYKSNRTTADGTSGGSGLNANGAVYLFFPHDQDYLGCFADATLKDFEVEVASRHDMLSLSMCEQLCMDYEYYAIQRGMNCFCSTEYPAYEQVDETFCDTPCTDTNDTGSCGGIWFNSVYRNVYYTHNNHSGLFWVQHDKITASDESVDDYFGAIVALDNDTLVVSSWRNPAMSHATWSFEKGDTQGWLITGDAFTNQPTYGENVLYRTVYDRPSFNLTTSGRYLTWAHTHPFNGSDFVSDPDSFDSTMSNETTLTECTQMCDDEGDGCLGFLRLDVGVTVLSLCTLVLRETFQPYGIYESHVAPWNDGLFYVKEGAQPFFHYTKSTDRFARYFGFHGVKSNVKVKPQGNWWIGTYEDHPVEQSYEYSPQGSDANVDSGYAWGDAQGDAPTGTMASTPFLINGAEMSFLIGGGCDDQKIFAELVVGRQAIRRATGRCTETMRRVTWNVAEYQGQAAVLRLADLSSVSPWGHLNFDGVQFSWTVEGHGSGNDFSSASSRQIDQAGAAYVFRRHQAGDELEPCACECSLDVPDYFKHTLQMRSGESFEEHCFCTNNKWDCEWSQEVKLQASDKHTAAYFGRSIDVSQEHGVLVVGAHNARAQSLFDNLDHNRKYQNVDEYLNDDGVGIGAVYIFTRQEEFRDAYGAQVHYASWAQDYAHALRSYSDVDAMLTDVAANPIFPSTNSVSTERLRLQAVGPQNPGDSFGFSVALSADSLLVGAPGVGYSGYASTSRSGGIARHTGAGYMLDTRFRFAQFSKRRAIVAEADPGDHSTHQPGYRLIAHVTWLTVELTRSGDMTDALRLGYVTSDVTAQGVTQTEAEQCLATPYRNRTSSLCGDYVHLQGEVQFLARESLAQIVIPIMDDECSEGTEDFILQLTTIGGEPLLGEVYSMVVEIHDNDFEKNEC
jgi:hypothetical protein